jgi:hypothetical protein
MAGLLPGERFIDAEGPRHGDAGGDRDALVHERTLAGTEEGVNWGAVAVRSSTPIYIAPMAEKMNQDLLLIR